MRFARGYFAFWLGRRGTLGGRDRVQHPATCYAKMNDLMAEMTQGAERRRHEAARDEVLPLILNDLYRYDDDDGIGPRLAYAVNVLGLTPANKLNSPFYRDGYQPSFYAMHNGQLWLEAGMRGLPGFSGEDFQRAVSGTVHQLFAGAPYTYRLADGKTGTVTAYQNCAPRGDQWLDGTKPELKPPARRFDNGQAKTVRDAAGKTLTTTARELTMGGDLRTSEHFRSAEYMTQSGAGMALAFATDAHAEAAQAHVWGGSEDPTVEGHQVGYPVGEALRLLLGAGLIEW